MLARAQRKFDELDTDHNGFLDGAEVIELANSLWRIFHPGGEPITDEKRKQLCIDLLLRVDSNNDGKISFQEFSGWSVLTLTLTLWWRAASAEE